MTNICLIQMSAYFLVQLDLLLFKITSDQCEQGFISTETHREVSGGISYNTRILE